MNSESPYLLGYFAYWDGKQVYEIPPAQAEGWWDARSEIQDFSG
jgi:hypothetical protein